MAVEDADDLYPLICIPIDHQVRAAGMPEAQQLPHAASRSRNKDWGISSRTNIRCRWLSAAPDKTQLLQSVQDARRGTKRPTEVMCRGLWCDQVGQMPCVKPNSLRRFMLDYRSITAAPFLSSLCPIRLHYRARWRYALRHDKIRSKQPQNIARHP